MGAKVFIYIEENKCGYTFKNKRRRMKGLNFPPEPYSKLSSSGEEIILTKEEIKDWTKAYYQAVEELGACMFSRDEKVYRKVDEILKEMGNWRNRSIPTQFGTSESTHSVMKMTMERH